MEKVIYAVWKREDQTREALNALLLNELCAQLAALSHSLRINVQNESVASGTSPRAVSTTPQMDAIVQLWVDSANDQQRAPVDAIFSEAGLRVEAFLVSESVPLPNTQHPPQAGQPTEGFSQIVFLSRPEGLAWEKWREIWHDSHTQIAIDTQSNFEYRQNLVTRRLTPGSAHYAAIIEECFPMAALSDPLTYFDAPGDADTMQKNLGIMIDSTARFIDRARMDCIPTRQFDVKVFPTS